MARLFVTGINLNKNELQNARIQNLSSAPSSPVLGQIYYDTSNNVMYYYNGLSSPDGPWMPMSGSTEVIQDIISSTLQAGEGIDLTYSDPAGTVTIDAEIATTSNRGVASFNTDDFNVTDGHVEYKDTTVRSVKTDTGVLTPASHEFSILGGEGIDVTHSGAVISVAGEDASDTNKGVASFSSTDFLVTNGHVSLVSESVQDIVGGMVSGNSESGISVTYDDANGKLDFDVNDPTITLSGDVTGSGTITNLGNVTITTTIEPNSITLGTDTTGDYIKSISGTANEVEVSGSGGETATVTIGLPDNVTITTDLTVGQDINLRRNVVFEGATANDYETTLSVTDPLTADRTITLPDNTGTVILDVNTVNSLATPTADFSMGGNKITNLGAPQNSTDAATKGYVDAVSEGLHIHASVVAATTTNISLTGYGPANPLILDGVTIQNQQRVLVKNQNTASQNGIYVYNDVQGVLDRALDFDAPAEVDGGDFLFVTSGNTQADTGWVQTSELVATIGTDPIYFTQFSGAGTFTAGAGLDLNGTVFSVDTTPNSGNATIKTDNGATEVKFNSNKGLSTDASGLIVNAGTGFAFDALGALTNDTFNGYGVRKKAFSIGTVTPATSFTVTHNLSTKDVTVHIYETASPHAQVEADIEHTTNDTITVKFATAPTFEQYRVVIVG